MLPNLLDYSFEELQDFVTGLGEPSFRAAQLWQWMWQKGVGDFADMTNLSKVFRAKLGETAVVAPPDIADIQISSDTTTKFLLRMADGELVETVLIPEPTHYTQCLSTQAGCAMACTFCSTGTMGFIRNLTQAEMAGQVLAVRNYLRDREVDPKKLRNLVFMGMGEPMQNMDNLIKTLRTLHHDSGLSIGARRCTVSTVGIPGTLQEFGKHDLALLAVSLHAPTQELRERIMPKAARAYPLDKLMDDLRAYPVRPRERVTLEYVLLDGVNDSIDHARELVRLLSRLKCKVNLIAYNPGRTSRYRAPSPENVRAFSEALNAKGITCTVRRSKGQDIAAACGQLALEEKREEKGK
jgi:23S rRNA (adenine2503-C2)-methyltransferase